jgi:hypothetical protein
LVFLKVDQTCRHEPRPTFREVWAIREVESKMFHFPFSRFPYSVEKEFGLAYSLQYPAPEEPWNTSWKLAKLCFHEFSMEFPGKRQF